MLGKWLDDEQERFIKAMELFPKDWNKITAYVLVKTIFQHRLEQEQTTGSESCQKYQRHLEDAVRIPGLLLLSRNSSTICSIIGLTSNVRW